MISFKALFRVLNKYLANDEDVPEFFRTVMALVTDVPESDWGTSKDPVDRLSDSTIRSYISRGLSKKLAKNIVYHLTLEKLEGRIWDFDDEPRELMAQDLSGYDPTVNGKNVAGKICQWLQEMIRSQAGLITQSELELQHQAQINADLMGKYGEYLLREAHQHCAMPGCDHLLNVSKNGKVQPVFAVAIIDKTLDPELGNLIAMCPRCQGTYQLDDSKKLRTQLRAAKKMLSDQIRTEEILDTIELDKGITAVVRGISKLKHGELAQARLDPKELVNKIDENIEYALYITVRNFVLDYFTKVRTIITSLDKGGEIDYDEVQDQMRSIYKKLAKTKATKTQIFTNIYTKVHRATLQEDIYCQIFVCYFIQTCEVFDAIA